MPEGTVPIPTRRTTEEDTLRACPEGTVPIRRTIEEDTLRANSISRFGRIPRPGPYGETQRALGPCYCFHF